MAKSMRRLRDRTTNNPLTYFCPTPPQEAFLKDKSKIKLLLGGIYLVSFEEIPMLIMILSFFLACNGCTKDADSADTAAEQSK